MCGNCCSKLKPSDALPPQYRDELYEICRVFRESELSYLDNYATGEARRTTDFRWLRAKVAKSCRFPCGARFPRTQSLEYNAGCAYGITVHPRRYSYADYSRQK